jgi:hypothetical protein
MSKKLSSTLIRATSKDVVALGMRNFCTFYLTDLPGEQKDDDYALQNVRHGAFLAAKP